jgi:hypothetical protein
MPLDGMVRTEANKECIKIRFLLDPDGLLGRVVEACIGEQAGVEQVGVEEPFLLIALTL